MTLTSILSDTVSSFWNRATPEIESEKPPEIPDYPEAPPDVRRLIREGRYCKLAVADSDLPFDEESVGYAWKAIEQYMALVPAGDVALVSSYAVVAPCGFDLTTTQKHQAPVNSNYVDRNPVTNQEYSRFVEAGGYANPNLWPEELLPKVLQFVDSTGQPGPKYWQNGKPLEGKLTHPVVGISWYEACAYGQWVSKRLPTSAEWQRAGTWPKSLSGDVREMHYPWGNAFDPSRANTWAAGNADTTDVRTFENGRTPNGISHLIGNVWEWVDTEFTIGSDGNVSVVAEQRMAEVRGGAFDTYFHSQATCQFRSGQPLMYRGPNVGFRCCVSRDRLTQPPVLTNGLLDEVSK